MKNVLIVDDDRILRRLIKNKLDKLADTFTSILAENGREAVDLLKAHPVSLVVTDLQMPEMDGFALLAHLSAHYPDIPVVILTAYSTPDAKKKVLAGGAIGYLEKPFVIEDLSRQITRALARESEGGMLQTVPLETFVQLIEMEQKTCTIRVTEKQSGRQGVLFFRGGDLMDARVGDHQGQDAAYEIFSWEKVTLSIQDDCALKEKRIADGLQAILFDAMRLRDEAQADGPGDFEEEMASAGAPAPQPLDAEPSVLAPADALPDDAWPPPSDSDPPSSLDRLRREVTAVARGRDGVEDIYSDAAWDPLMHAAAALGRAFTAGRLRACYIANETEKQYIPCNRTKPPLWSPYGRTAHGTSSSRYFTADPGRPVSSDAQLRLPRMQKNFKEILEIEDVLGVLFMTRDGTLRFRSFKDEALKNAASGDWAEIILALGQGTLGRSGLRK